MEAFLRDERGMSRMDCLFIQLILVVLAALALYAFKDSDDLKEPVSDGVPVAGVESAVETSAKTGAAFLGVPVVDIVLWLLCAAAAVFVIRLVVEARS